MRLRIRPPGKPLLEVAERVDGDAVDPDLEMEVRAGAEAGAADVADHLALRDVLAAGDRDARLVAVRRGEAAAVVDHHEVAVAGLPAAVDDAAGSGGVDRRAVWDADVDAGMEPAPAGAERARDRAAHGPDEPARARRGRRGRTRAAAAGGAARVGRLGRPDPGREVGAR